MKLFTHPPEVYWRIYHRKRHRRLCHIPAEEQKCLNCGTKYYGNYCPVCGQSHQVKSLTILHLLRNFWLSLITLRRGYAITLFELTGHPSCFIRRYIGGHRSPYIHPFRLLLVLLTIYVLFSLTFMPEQLPKDQHFGFTAYLNTIQTGDWRQTIAQYLITALLFIHETPLLQMSAARFEDWFFQNPALQAVTLFPLFAVFSYILFHDGTPDDEEQDTEEGAEEILKRDKAPGIFETTIKEPLRPLWEILRITRIKIGKLIAIGWEKFSAWWIRNFDKPVLLIKTIHFLNRIARKCLSFLKRGLQVTKVKKTNVRPMTYDFIEVIYMRGYFTCLLMEVNLLLFFWGISVTPFNIWVVIGTICIYRSFFRWRWWNTIKRMVWMYVLTFLCTGLYCMITAIMDVIKE